MSLAIKAKSLRRLLKCPESHHANDHILPEMAITMEITPQGVSLSITLADKRDSKDLSGGWRISRCRG